jgi:hypothetical protein
LKNDSRFFEEQFWIFKKTILDFLKNDSRFFEEQFWIFPKTITKTQNRYQKSFTRLRTTETKNTLRTLRNEK